MKVLGQSVGAFEFAFTKPDISSEAFSGLRMFLPEHVRDIYGLSA